MHLAHWCFCQVRISICGYPCSRVCQEHEPIFQGLPGCLGLLCSRPVVTPRTANNQASKHSVKPPSNPRKKSHRSPANVGFMEWQCKPEDGANASLPNPDPFYLSCTDGASLINVLPFSSHQTQYWILGLGPSLIVILGVPSPPTQTSP